MARNHLSLILICHLWWSLAQAQESINAIGGDATGSGGSVAYSLGQVVYTTQIGAGGRVAQGVQHAYEIFLGLEDAPSIFSLLVFPNPTTDDLTLQVIDFEKESLTYQVYDMQGKLLLSGQIKAQQTQIQSSKWPSATYFIHVLDSGHRKVQSFKIIKN
jgi:hypothetical protein